MKSYIVHITETCGMLEFPAECLVRCEESDLQAKLDIVKLYWRPIDADTVERVWAQPIPDDHYDLLAKHDYIHEFDFDIEEEEDEEDETY